MREEVGVTRCVVCTCTYQHACDNGCSWAPNLADGSAICSNCADLLQAMREWSEIARRARWGVLLKLAKAEKCFAPKQQKRGIQRGTANLIRRLDETFGKPGGNPRKPVVRKLGLPSAER